jgi:serine/threonine protein kinase
LSGLLSAPEGEFLLSHLEACDSCVERVEQLRSNDALIDIIREARTKGESQGTEAVSRLLEQLRKLKSISRAPAVSDPIVLSCAGCGKRIKAKGNLAGKEVKCPNCGNKMMIPSALQASEEATLPPASVETASSSELASMPDIHDRPTASFRQPPEGTREWELCQFLAPAQSSEELGRLGPYRVLQVLGSGGMGIVYKAEDIQLKRLVALKAMLPTLGASEDARKRFLREAQAAAAINHDNVVRIYQVGEDRGVPFMAMQLLEGESLDTRLKRKGQLALSEVLRIGRETAEGMAAAHSRGLVHRDIKPPNLWLEGENRRVKILDFGVARATDDNAHLTQTGAIVGTPAYMAPEQASAKPVDHRSDLFSLGCVLYRLATGELPFKGNDPITILAALALETPAPPAELNPDVPGELSDLVMRLLAKDAKQRPDSARVVAKEIQTIEKGISGHGVRRRPGRTQLGVSGPRKGETREGGGKQLPPLPWMIGTAGGFAALLMGIVIYWTTRNGVVKIESDDPNVQIVFDKDGPAISGASKGAIKLRPGEHGILVKRGDFEFETDKLALKNGQTVQLKVELLRGKMQVTADGHVLAEVELPSRAPPPLDLVKKPTPAPTTVPTIMKMDKAPKLANDPSPKASSPGPCPPPKPDPRVLTVSQKPEGGGRFRTVQEAVDRAEPGMTIRVLDDAVYAEYIRIDRPLRQRGITLEASHQATLCKVHGARETVAIINVPEVTVRGFHFESSDERTTQIFIGGKSPGVLIDQLDMKSPWTCLNIYSVTLTGQDAPIIIQNCILQSGPQGGQAVRLEGYRENDNSPATCAHVVVRNNTLLGGRDGLWANGLVHEVLVVGNRFLECGAAIVLLDLLPGTAGIVIANNTFLANKSSLFIWDDHAKGKIFLQCKNMRIANNLVLGSLVPDDMSLLNRPWGGGKFGPADLESLLKLKNEWRFDHNWREVDAKKAAAATPGRWIPGPNDQLRLSINDVSRTLNDPHFLRPHPGSPLARGGAGVTDPSLPAYVGALPPDGVEPWDWNKTWSALVR